MPMPQPPVGGRPCSSASMNVSSTSCASSSPCAFCRTCSSNRARCSNGSFSSVYALQISFPQRKPSKRSHRPGRLRCHLASGDITCGCPTARMIVSDGGSELGEDTRQ
jgi:hypothetical protein